MTACIDIGNLRDSYKGRDVVYVYAGGYISEYGKIVEWDHELVYVLFNGDRVTYRCRSKSTVSSLWTYNIYNTRK